MHDLRSKVSLRSGANSGIGSAFAIASGAKRAGVALCNFSAAIPMGRLGTPEECVDGCPFLASELASNSVIDQAVEANRGQVMP